MIFKEKVAHLAPTKSTSNWRSTQEGNRSSGIVATGRPATAAPTSPHHGRRHTGAPKNTRTAGDEGHAGTRICSMLTSLPHNSQRQHHHHPLVPPAERRAPNRCPQGGRRHHSAAIDRSRRSRGYPEASTGGEGRTAPRRCLQEEERRRKASSSPLQPQAGDKVSPGADPRPPPVPQPDHTSFLRPAHRSITPQHAQVAGIWIPSAKRPHRRHLRPPETAPKGATTAIAKARGRLVGNRAPAARARRHPG